MAFVLSLDVNHKAETFCASANLDFTDAVKCNLLILIKKANVTLLHEHKTGNQ